MYFRPVSMVGNERGLSSCGIQHRAEQMRSVGLEWVQLA
jgi:hypothetical protein